MEILSKIKPKNVHILPWIFFFSFFLYFLSALCFVWKLSVSPQNSTATLFLQIIYLCSYWDFCNFKTEFGEACAEGEGKRGAALLLPTMRCAFHATSQREVTALTLLCENCGYPLPWVSSKIPTDVNCNMIKTTVRGQEMSLSLKTDNVRFWVLFVKYPGEVSTKNVQPTLQLFQPCVSFHTYYENDDILQWTRREECVTP